MTLQDDEILREFLVESHENLDRLDHDIVALEAEPAVERIASIFRTVHTVKGTAGFLGFPASSRSPTRARTTREAARR